MKSGKQGQTADGPSEKTKSKKDDKILQGISVRSKAVSGLSCRKSGTSVGKVSIQRRKNIVNNLVAAGLEHCIDAKCLSSPPKQRTLQTSGNDNGYDLHLPLTPSLHPQSPVMTSIITGNPPLEFPATVRVQSSFQIQKFQLQLFPMDEITRKCLQEENHCPYLELTITIKKKIASVIRHLNNKWGNSRSASEELVLFPYNVRVENLESYRRWTLKDSDITVAEVHAAIGKPAVFRLRYGWLSILDPKFSNSSQTYHNFANHLSSTEVQKKDAEDDCEKVLCIGVSQECEPLLAEPLLKQDALETAPMKTIQAADNPRPDNDAKLSWVDCVSNMSFGALLSEVEAEEGAKLNRETPQRQIAISCDSFDAAIAAHIVRYQTGNQSSTMAQPSILDAEETCNPFLFHNFTSLNKNIRVQSQVTTITSANENSEHHRVKLCKVPNAPVEPLNTTSTCVDEAQPIKEENNLVVVDDWQGNKHNEEEDKVDIIKGIHNVNNQFDGLDKHWPPSAGPWQFIASSQQVISSDSNELNGLCFYPS